MNYAVDTTDLVTRVLQAALRVLHVDHPIRLGIGLLLGIVFLGIFDVVFDRFTLFRVAMCLAAGPFLTMVPLIFPGHRSTRESIKQSLDAAELIMERAQFDTWMRQEFYRKVLNGIQSNLLSSANEPTKDPGVEKTVKDIIKMEL